jgi:periplasmic glucans biosynthesis protein
VPPLLRLLLVSSTLSIQLHSQTWEREEIDFGKIQEKAKDLAGKTYTAPDRESLPEWMKRLTYDQYRDIRFTPEEALWSKDELPFRAMLFHPGYLFLEPVVVNEFTSTHLQRVRLAEAFFNYGPLIKEHGELPADGGFAGVRLHAPLNNADYFDELAVFQGASYWRALGKGQRYGISARGIAIDTGAEGAEEEFPSFREFWLRKPEPGDQTARLYALLNGPSCSGAYAFTIVPGEETVMEVEAVLYFRKPVKRLGIAPMSSMFWFGENSRRRFDDFRPEVHDTDGLSIRMGTGERLWRPIANDSGNLEFSFFQMEKCEGFGLLQRDRRFSAYEDDEAAYHLRPSLWIEPTSDWGPGSVMLMEIPTGNELADNTVAMWQPAREPQAGERLAFSYRQKWTMAEDPSQAGGHVVATRTGVHEWQPEQRTITVDFAGGRLAEESPAPLEAQVEALGEAREKVLIQGVSVQALPEGRWRAAFQIAPAEEGGKLSELGPVELRCALKRGDDYLTETWTYRVIP